MKTDNILIEVNVNWGKVCCDIIEKYNIDHDDVLKFINSNIGNYIKVKG